MKFLKFFPFITILFLVFSISLGAQKTKKGKQKPDPKPTKETTKVSPTDKKQKEDTLISVKTDTVQPVEEKSEKKEKEESSTQAKDEAKNPTPVREEPSITPVSTPVKKQADTTDTINPITLNQYFSNDIWFRGFSVLGDRLAQRDNRQFQSMQHAWNVVTGVSYSPTENFSIGTQSKQG